MRTLANYALTALSASNPRSVLLLRGFHMASPVGHKKSSCVADTINEASSKEMLFFLFLVSFSCG
jgi:hypothetical protein